MAGKHMRVEPEAARAKTSAPVQGKPAGIRARALGVAAAVLVVAGLAVMALPWVMQWLYARRADAGEAAFSREAEDLRADDGASEGIDLSGLLAAMRAYNQKLDDEGQAGLRDAWSYEQPSFRLAEWGLDSEVIGYLDIPRMEVTLPIYLGATEENMLAGAAQLSQTSLPIGSWEGSSVNTVIAAHRNHWSAGMFHDIEKMQVGDPVYIKNLWETLEYRVVGVAVIDPSDINAVKIQPGRDMVTLVTCHPLYHNYQRYVVYCERAAGNTASAETGGAR